MGWTPEQDGRRRDMAAQGYSASQIACVLGKTRNSVIGRSHRNGAPTRGGNAPRVQWTEERYAQLRKLYIGAYTVAQMAEKLGVSTKVIAKRLHMMRKRGVVGRRSKSARPPRMTPTWRDREPIKVNAEPVTLLELAYNHCRYIVGPIDAGRTLYCGAEAVPSLSWCPTHCGVVFTDMPMRKFPSVWNR